MEVLQKLPPLYTVYYYSDFLYRVVKFKRSSDGLRLSDPDKEKEIPDSKFAQSYCRARSMVLQYSLCNKWDYFITCTVSASKFDRYELEPIAKSMKQWFLDYGKKFDCHIDFVLVPEFHKDGAWHFHGLIRGIPFHHLCEFPDDPYRPTLKRLHDKGYWNWPALMRKIGYCSLSPVRNPVGVGFYVTKYITKQNARCGFYEHLYYCSRGLNTARPVSDAYCYIPQLESALTFECDFCSTGWIRGEDFTFEASDFLEPRVFDKFEPVNLEAIAIETKLSFVQLSLEDWLLDSGGMV